MQGFIIDTSCLVQAYRGHYPFDVAPSFWLFMKEQFQNGRFILTSKVFNEIKKGNDDLCEWTKNHIGSMEFKCHEDMNVMTNYASIMLWATSHPRYSSLAKQIFADYETADPFLVATAMANQGIVVSQEISALQAKSSVKLPDVCSQFNILHLDTVSLLRQLGFSM